MKSLKESIECVMKSGKSITTKRAELLKLGLRSNDVYNIIYVYNQTHPQVPRQPRVTPFTYKFGVELEVLCNRAAVTSSLSADNVAFNWSGTYFHSNGNRYFDFKRDGSLYTDNHTLSGNSPIEMVSPVLGNGRCDFKMLKKACNALENNNAQVNKSTGFHVHISSPAIDDTCFVNVFKNYQKLESLIDTFMPNSRRGSNNDYCKSLASLDFTHCNSIADVMLVMRNNRYYKVNAMAWGTHSTIEYRQHSGTTSYKKVENWVKFCAALTAWSKENVFDHEVTNIDEVPFLTATQKAYFKSRQLQLNHNIEAA